MLYRIVFTISKCVLTIWHLVSCQQSSGELVVCIYYSYCTAFGVANLVYMLMAKRFLGIALRVGCMQKCLKWSVALHAMISKQTISFIFQRERERTFDFCRNFGLHVLWKLIFARQKTQFVRHRPVHTCNSGQNGSFATSESIRCIIWLEHESNTVGLRSIAFNSH